LPPRALNTVLRLTWAGSAMASMVAAACRG
jgi:hypothetical protein